jgi:hypothetical protein
MCTIFSLSAMDPKTIGTIPDYCSTLTTWLQGENIQYNPSDSDIHNYRILFCRWDDSRIIEILSKNVDMVTPNAKKRYPMAITSFMKYVKDKSGKSKLYYGIKSPAGNQNYLTKRICFRIIDRLQEGWAVSDPNEYYTHPHKEYPEDTHKSTIYKWFFLSKGTDKTRPNFLIDEAELIRFLSLRFGISDKVTCRATMTNDLKRVAGIHIWVLKSAFQEFQRIFDFDYAKNSKITYRSVLNV